MGSLVCLNEQGDITVEWDADDPASVEKAQKEWARLKEDGYEFFEVVETKGKRVQRFSKNLGKVIASPGVRTAKDKESGTRERAMAGGPNTQLATR